MDGIDSDEAIVPDLGNYSEYSPQLKAIFQSAADAGDALYISLKEAAKTGTITVNTNYLPANCKIFEGSARYMTKPDEELLMEERMEGIKEGKEEGIAIGKEEGITIGKEEGVIISAKVISALRANEPIESISKRFKISAEGIMQIQSALPIGQGLSA